MDTVRVTEEGALASLIEAGSMSMMRAAVRALSARGYRWAPLGGKEGNYGLVNIGSDPGTAFVERITNAIDAVIEDAAGRADPTFVAELESPREAARALFAIPEGRLDPAAALDPALPGRVTVSLYDGASAGRPVLEVRDDGCGIAPDDAPATILNLAGSNKIAKPYLAGAYGQGGSTTFAFAPMGTIIASATDTSDLGVTVVRFRELDARRNKNGRYDYLVRADGSIGRLPRQETTRRGTVVRHLGYELTGYDGPGGLLTLARVALFDPILPFTIVDARGGAQRHIAYLGHFAELQCAEPDRVVYRQSVTVPFGPHGRDGVAAVHYWVLGEEDAALHPDPTHPIVLTNFGQTHGVEDRRFVVDALALPYLRNVLVVQIELDGLTPAVKRALLSTTRDRLKRGARTRELLAAVADALAEDEGLRACNAQRRQRLLAQRTAADQQRLRRRFATLLEKFRPGEEPAARNRAGSGTAEAASSGGEGDGAAQEALPTLEHPTFVRIVHGEEPLELARGRTTHVTLECDAPDGYLTRYAEARLVVVAAPFEAVEFVRVSDVRAGRMRAVVRAVGALDVCGMLIARLTDAKGTVLDDAAAFRIVAPPPPQPASTNGAARVRVPEIYEVYRAEWGPHGFEERSVANVAESSDEYSIWVNMDNVHLQRLLAGIPYQETGLARMKTAFLVQVAFYAFLLHQSRERNDGLDPEALERYQSGELDRLAQTVISSIASVERLDSALFELT